MDRIACNHAMRSMPAFRYFPILLTKFNERGSIRDRIL